MKKFFISILFIAILTVLLAPSLASAVDLQDPTGLGKDVGTREIQIQIGKVASIVVGTAGSFALLMFVYGGFLMMTSAGSTDRLNTGKQVLTWAVIGLLSIMLSYVVLRLIIEAVTGGSITA